LIKAVVFDMDGVLCRYLIDRRLALLASWSGQSPEAIHAAIWRSGFDFDDDATYAAGAREAGLSACRVRGAEDVRSRLAVHGLAR